MRKYETVFISDPDLQDQTRSDLFDKIRNIITNEKGILLNLDEWGNKKLAYEIKKKTRGHYVCVTYGGTGDLVKELERNFRLSDDVMKFMTILLSDDVTVEQLEEEAQEANKTDEPAEVTPDTESDETKSDETEAVEEVVSTDEEKVEETEEKTE